MKRASLLFATLSLLSACVTDDIPADDGVANEAPTSEAAAKTARAAAARQWQPPSVVGDASGNFYPAVTIDSNGVVIALWTSTSSVFGTDLLTSRYSPQSGTWSPPEAINMRKKPVEQIQVAADGNGNAFAAWRQEKRVLASRYTANVGWTIPRYMGVTGEDAAGFALAVTAAGDAHVIVSHSFQQVTSTRFKLGTGWEAPVRINGTVGADEGPYAGVDNQGNVFAAWNTNHFDAGAWKTRVEVARFSTSSGWQPLQVGPASLGGDVPDLRIAVAGNGDAMVAFRQRNLPFSAMRYTRSSGWGALETIANELPSSIQIAGDGDGDFTVVWDELHSRRYVRGSGWTTPVDLALDIPGFRRDGVLVANPQGHVHLVWTSELSSGHQIWATGYTGRDPWRAPVLISSTSGSSFMPALAVDTSGNAAAVWNFQNSGQQLAFAQYR